MWLTEVNSVRFNLVTQACPTLCDSMDCSTPGFPVHHLLPELAQTRAHRVCDAIQPSHPLRPLLLLPSTFPSIRVFSTELALLIRWPKYCSFSIRSSNEYSGLISLRMAWLDLLAFQGTLKSLLQHRGSRASSGGTSSLMQIHMCTRFASVSRSVIKEYEVE